MTRLQAFPGAFCHEERDWYRGLTVLDQNVIPVVNPAGFLTAEEICAAGRRHRASKLCQTLTASIAAGIDPMTWMEPTRYLLLRSPSPR